MLATNDFLKAYVLQGGINEVSGWLGNGAVSITLAINAWQKEHKVTGDVAEIGIHHGKFFILLKNTCTAGEIAFAIDVFSDQHLNPDGSGRGDKEKFTTHLARHSNNNDVVILQMDSLSLQEIDFVHGGQPANIRLFSVDGSHTAAHTVNDLNISSTVLGHNGVVILDDYTNPAWPGVQEGFHQFMFEHRDKFAVLGYGDNKMIICRIAAHSALFEFMKAQLPAMSAWHKKVLLHGKEAFAFRMKAPSEIFDPDLQMRRVLLPKSDLPCRLSKGWGRVEANGVWSIDDLAELEIELDGTIRTFQMLLRPFLPTTRRARGIRIFLEDRLLAERSLAGASALNIDLPSALSGPAICSLAIEQPERPADFGGSDVRRLGVFLTGLRRHSDS